MDKRKMAAALAALMLAIPAAQAKSSLSAQMVDGEMRIFWQTDRVISGGTLTVYRDSWPVLVQGACGSSGQVTVPQGVVADSGKVKVALRANGTCMTTTLRANPAQPEPTMTPNSTPAPVPTAKPEATPAPASTSAPVPDAPSGSAGLASDLIDEVNRDRAAQGLGEVEYDEALTKAACVRAQEIVQKFSHTRPDSTSWSTVYSGAYAENIARGYDTAYKCEAAFMSSSGHRANILRAQYTKIGVCALRVDNVTYWVQLFGR